MLTDEETTAACENCRFWIYASKTLNYGACRRNAPTFVPKFSSILNQFPETPGSFWCGQWEKRND